jgi:hypothetical protein
MRNDRSKWEIERWTKILADTRHLTNKAFQNPKTRLRNYLAGLTLGREFGESMESLLERRGLVEFWAWATEQVK